MARPRRPNSKLLILEVQRLALKAIADQLPQRFLPQRFLPPRPPPTAMARGPKLRLPQGLLPPRPPPTAARGPKPRMLGRKLWYQRAPARPTQSRLRRRSKCRTLGQKLRYLQAPARPTKSRRWRRSKCRTLGQKLRCLRAPARKSKLERLGQKLRFQPTSLRLRAAGRKTRPPSTRKSCDQRPSRLLCRHPLEPPPSSATVHLPVLLYLQLHHSRQDARCHSLPRRPPPPSEGRPSPRRALRRLQVRLRLAWRRLWQCQ
mmetsp:Transcript_92595/g.265407  ORF Transcript_92595/g.265407 Transcript_92595/m.265407 type:complete len:260 (-) Transcript_92595:28-807(-)